MTGRHRWFLVLVAAVGAMRAEAQERTAQAVRRRLVVPQKADPTAYVPEVRVSPGFATTLHLPAPLHPGGLALDKTAKGRVKATQTFPTEVVLSASTELGEEQLSLTVITMEGRSYSFLLTTRPGVWDSEVTVALEQTSSSDQQTVGSIMETLLDGEVLDLHVRHYKEPPRPATGLSQGSDVDYYAQTAVRKGNLYFIQALSYRPEPWAVQEARLVGPNGETLTVLDIRSRPRLGHSSFNIVVIVAEVPGSAREDYTLTSIQLTGRDGMVATVTGEVRLP